MVNKHGEARTCLTLLRLYREQGILEGSIIDITERKQAEEILHVSEEKYQSIFNLSKDAIVISTENGELLETNQVALDLFGAESFGEVKNYNAVDFWFDPEDRQQLVSNIKQKGFVPDFETNLKRADGTVIDVHASAVKVDSEQGVFIVSSIRDVSKRKQAE
jgi:PAS domain S-box-containing protein